MHGNVFSRRIDKEDANYTRDDRDDAELVIGKPLPPVEPCPHARDAEGKNDGTAQQREDTDDPRDPRDKGALRSKDEKNPDKEPCATRDIDALSNLEELNYCPHIFRPHEEDSARDDVKDAQCGYEISHKAPPFF